MTRGGRPVALLLGAVALATGGFLVGRRHQGPPRERLGTEPSEEAEKTPAPQQRAFSADLPRFVLPVPVPAPPPADPPRPGAAGEGPTEEQRVQQRALQAELDRVMRDEVAPLRTEEDLSRYLAQLIDRAQSMKSIPVTIVQPGRVAIARVISDPMIRQERVTAFLRSLDELRGKLAAQ